MPEEEKRYEFVQLHSGGPLPGLPGDHAPGSYVIDWRQRTITPDLSLEAFLEAKQGAEEPAAFRVAADVPGEPLAVLPETPPALSKEQQLQNGQEPSETAESSPVENVTDDTSSSTNIFHLDTGS